MNKEELIKELTFIQSMTPEANDCYYKDECHKYPKCTPIKQKKKLVKRVTGENLDFECLYKKLEDLIERIENE